MELAEEFETDPNLGVPVHSLKIRKPTLWLLQPNVSVIQLQGDHTEVLKS